MEKNIVLENFGRLPEELKAVFYCPLKSDIEEEEDKYILRIDAPGFEKEDMHLHVEGRELFVQARKETKKEEEEKKRFIMRERVCRDVQRVFHMADDADEKSIAAKFENGVLEITVPKKEKEEKMENQIPIL